MAPETESAPAAMSTSELRAAVDSLDWYHTFDLPGGIVTPGIFDHRRVATKVPLPDLKGKTCLDVASSDGFWAVEMAKRGAAKVISVDLADATRQDWQGALRAAKLRSGGTGRAADAFALVTRTLGFEIERRDLSVYDLSPDEFGGEQFDFVFMGNLLLHLSDPVRALRAIHTVTGGQFFSYEMVLLWMSIWRPRTPRAQLWQLDEPRWWTPNIAAHRRMVRAAGFRIEQAGGPLFQPFGARLPAWPEGKLEIRPHGVRATAAYWLGVRRFGAPTSWILSRPIRD